MNTAKTRAGKMVSHKLPTSFLSKAKWATLMTNIAVVIVTKTAKGL